MSSRRGSRRARQRFEVAYARRSGVTIAALHKAGLHAVRCTCREPGCRGLAMMTVASWPSLDDAATTTSYRVVGRLTETRVEPSVDDVSVYTYEIGDS